MSGISSGKRGWKSPALEFAPISAAGLEILLLYKRLVQKQASLLQAFNRGVIPHLTQPAEVLLDPQQSQAANKLK